jgi:uncharacterized protein (TIGR01777 family)
MSSALHVGVTGSSGFVGGALVPFLEERGHRVQRLSRKPSRDEVEGLDAVVHLAGEPLFAARWTPDKKRRIRDSRVEGTRHLAETIASLAPDDRPSVLVTASAIGVYGSRGDELLDERATEGSGFLADVVRAWERAASPAADAGVRVVQPRIGIVLGSGGGALPRMATPFRLGAGGPLGDPAAWLSWISLDDLLDVLLRCIVDDSARGPINAVRGAVTQAELASAIGRVLHRPAFARVPRWALRAALGREQADEMLASTRVEPARLRALGHRFQHDTLQSALRCALVREAA